MWMFHHRFASRGALWIIRIVLIIVALTAIALGLSEAGDCAGGLKSPARCEHIQDELGQVAFNVGFLGSIFCYFAALPLAGLAVIWEVIAWWRKDP